MYTLLKFLVLPFLLFVEPPKKSSSFVSLLPAAAAQSKNREARQLLSSHPNFITEMGVDVTKDYHPIDLVHTLRLHNGYFLTTHICVREDDAQRQNLTCLMAYDPVTEQQVYQGVYGRGSSFYRPIKSIQAPVSPYIVLTATNIEELGQPAGATFFATFPNNGHLFFSRRLNSLSDRLTDILVTEDAIYLSGNDGSSQQLRKISLQDLTPFFSKQYPDTGASEMGRGLYFDPIGQRLLLSGTEPASSCQENSFGRDRYATILSINATTGNLTHPVLKFLESKRTICLDMVRFANSYVATCRTYRRCLDNSDFVKGVVAFDLQLSTRLFGFTSLDRSENSIRLSVANDTLLVTIHRQFINEAVPSYSQTTRLLRKSSLDNSGWQGYQIAFPTLDRLAWQLVASETDRSGKTVITFIDRLNTRRGGVMYVNHFIEEDFSYCGDLTTSYGTSVGSIGEIAIGPWLNSSSLLPFLENFGFQQLSYQHGGYMQTLCGPTRSPTRSPTKPTRAPTLRPTSSTGAPTLQPTRGSVGPTDSPTTEPTNAPTNAPTNDFSPYVNYKMSIEGTDTVHGITFLEGRHPVLIVENQESGLWYSISDESNNLLSVKRIVVGATTQLYPHSFIAAKGLYAGMISFSGNRVGTTNLRSLHFLIFDAAGYVAATARLEQKELAGYAELIPYNSSHAIWNGRFRYGRKEERLIIGSYPFHETGGCRGCPAFQSDHYVQLWNRGMKKASNGWYYGVSTVLRTTGSRSVLWYYTLSPPPLWRIGRTRFLASRNHNLHATSFALTDEAALWTLHMPVGGRKNFAIVAEITSDHRKGQIYELHAANGAPIYLTAIELVRDTFDQQDHQQNIFLAGYTNQVPLLGARALCIARYDNSFNNIWSFAYNSSIMKEKEVFLKPYRAGFYVAATTSMGVLEALFNSSTGSLQGHVAYPIELFLINYTQNWTFYFDRVTLPAFSKIATNFQNYTVILREKGDLGSIPLNQQAVRIQQKARKKGRKMNNDREIIFISSASSFMGIIFVGLLYTLVHYCKKKKKKKQQRIANRLGSLSSVEL